MTLAHLFFNNIMVVCFQDEALKAFWKHCPEADVDYVNTLIREVDDPTVLLVVAVGGDVKTGGQVTLSGPEDLLKQLSPK